MEMELIRYINEQSIKYNKDFDILLWWKQNASHYPSVSRMVKAFSMFMLMDILGLQISTVASLEAAFIEALIFIQDWVRKSRKLIVDNIDEILKDDEVANCLEEAINNELERENN
uniref:HAT C-terminal dimerisation domain-containing protein n=1 Tax=Lactuca sativa TaxID=4236 RepID=A0A9R1V824_LACSA|nr:hypothetical protein LSAT_V11C600318080 [Lactuca sativa]